MSEKKPKTRKRKRELHEVNHGTEMRDIKGVTPTVLQDLALLGYKIRSRTTFKEFKDITKSYSDFESKMRSMEVDNGMLLNKVRGMWQHVPGRAPLGDHDAVSQQQTQDTREGEQKSFAMNSNFLLANRDANGGPAAPIEERKNKETPEADALTRHPDPTKAVPLGNIVGGPAPAVVPDVTLNLSNDDQNINAPTEVLPGQPAPLIPAIAIGPAVVGSRYVAPRTLEEKQKDQGADDALPSTKASGGKDIGGDGYGALASEAKVGKDDPLHGDEDRPSTQVGPGTTRNSRFQFVPIGAGKGTASSATRKQPTSKMDWRSATNHPFKQASLFANHDAQMQTSKLLDKCYAESCVLGSADNLARDIQATDESWTTYNPMTQGVTAPYMPADSANYLSRGAMTTDFQMLGPSAMYNQFGPCPFVWEQMSGRFR